MNRRSAQFQPILHADFKMGSELMKNVQFALTEISFLVHRSFFSARIIDDMRVLLRSIAGRMYLAHEMG